MQSQVVFTKTPKAKFTQLLQANDDWQEANHYCFSMYIKFWL